MAQSPPPAARDATPDSSGRMAGEYRLGRKLGEGGFGAVYEAEHPLLKRRAAVKVLHRVAERDSEAVQRFISEAQAVNQIRSPHIVDIFSFGKLADGRHFYVMDLLEGEPLDRFLERMSRVDVATVVQLLRPIAEALDVAHAAGIVHRDLKPQNIFLAWDAAGTTVPKLLDFGMAKLIGDVGVHTVSGTPMGTPLYMSPEQARGQKVDRRSDVYALGVLCHELLTGSLPITGDTTIAVLMAHITEEPRRPSEVCPDLASSLDGPIASMLHKQPDQRPASAGEALRALAQAAESVGIEIPSGLPRLPRPEPLPESTRPGELSDTFAAVPEGRLSEDGSERVRAASSAERVESRRARWPWFALGVVLAGALLYFVIGARSARDAGEAMGTVPTANGARGSEKASAPLPVDAPQAAPPSAEPAESVVPAQSLAPADASLAAPRRKREPSGTPRKTAIPSDLENPF
jgi:eukaryotic-like serine/threonine-protein kinase